jgi:uncharacterized protein (TIGR03083 family)
MAGSSSSSLDASFDAVESSAELLAGLVTPLDDEQLMLPAYPTEWSIADVLSHIGSGAVIFQRHLDDALGDQQTPDDFAPSVWDTWNAKSPRQKADDALAADRALIERVDSLTEADRARFRFAMGPMTFDLTGFIGLRLNEHVLHTWDVNVALDPSAVLPPDAATLVVKELGLIAQYTAKATGATRTITIRTTAPTRQFTIDLTSDAVTFSPDATERDPDLTLPAEAFVRLVYGRLDPQHTPAVDGDSTALDELRHVFPGP